MFGCLSTLEELRQGPDDLSKTSSFCCNWELKTLLVQHPCKRAPNLFWAREEGVGKWETFFWLPGISGSLRTQTLQTQMSKSSYNFALTPSLSTSLASGDTVTNCHTSAGLTKQATPCLSIL